MYSNSALIASLEESRRILTSQVLKVASQPNPSVEARKALTAAERELDSISDQLLSLRKLNAAVERGENLGLNPSVSNDEKRAKINNLYRRALTGKAMPAELRDLATTSDAAGDALVNQPFFQSELIVALKQTAPLLDLATVKRGQSGAPAKFSVWNDTANDVAVVSETGSISSSSVDPSVFSKLIGTDMYNAQTIISLQEINDSEFDLLDTLKKAAVGKVARTIENVVTNGLSGTSYAANLVANVTTTGATATSIASTQAASTLVPYLTAMIGSVSDAYPDNVFQFSEATRTQLGNVLDSTGRPLFDKLYDGILLGRKVVINNALPSIATASSTPILYGSFSRGLGINIGSGIHVQPIFNAPGLAEQLLTSILLTVRVGSATLLPTISKFVQAAS